MGGTDVMGVEAAQNLEAALTQPSEPAATAGLDEGATAPEGTEQQPSKPDIAAQIKELLSDPSFSKFAADDPVEAIRKALHSYRDLESEHTRTTQELAATKNLREGRAEPQAQPTVFDLDDESLYAEFIQSPQKFMRGLRETWRDEILSAIDFHEQRRREVQTRSEDQWKEFCDLVPDAGKFENEIAAILNSDPRISLDRAYLKALRNAPQVPNKPLTMEPSSRGKPARAEVTPEEKLIQDITQDAAKYRGKPLGF